MKSKLTVLLIKYCIQKLHTLQLMMSPTFIINMIIDKAWVQGKARALYSN